MAALVKLRTQITDQQKEILLKFFDEGMISKGKEKAEYHNTAAKETGLDIKVVKEWVGNHAKKLSGRKYTYGTAVHTKGVSAYNVYVKEMKDSLGPMSTWAESWNMLSHTEKGEYAEERAAVIKDLAFLNPAREIKQMITEINSRHPRSPKTPKDIKVGRIMDQLKEKVAGDIADVTIPTPTQLVDMEKAAGRKMSTDDAISIQRSLRTMRDNALADKMFIRLLKNERKRQNVPYKDLIAPTLTAEDLVRNKCAVKIRESILQSKFLSMKKTYQSSSLNPEDDDLRALIKEQSWPYVCLRKTATKASEEGEKRMRSTDLMATTANKRSGVFANSNIQKGQVVCDYHGLTISLEEGEKRMRSTDPMATNYMLFYKQGKIV